MTDRIDWATGLMDVLGAPGAGAAIALENLFPPLPSEVILPLAGFAAGQGRVSLYAALLWTTAGSVVGALALRGGRAARPGPDPRDRRAASAGQGRRHRPGRDHWHRVTDYVSAYSKAVLGAAALAALGFAVTRLAALLSPGRGKRRG